MHISWKKLYLNKFVLLFTLLFNFICSLKLILPILLFYPIIVSGREDVLYKIINGAPHPGLVLLSSTAIKKFKLNEKLRQFLKLHHRFSSLFSWWTLISLLVAFLSLVAFGCYSIGIAFQSSSQTENALGLFNWAAILNPAAAEYRYHSGYIYHQNLDFDSAKREFNIMVKLDTELASQYAYESNENGYLLLSNSQIDEAIKAFDIAIMLAPTYAEYHYNLCYAYNKIGDTELSKAQCMMAIQKDSDFSAAYSILGYIYLKEGQCRESIEVLTIGIDTIRSSKEDEYYKDRVRYKLLTNLGGAYLCGDKPQYDLAIRSLYLAIDIEHNYQLYSDWVKRFRPARTHCLLAQAFDRNQTSCEFVEREISYCNNYAINNSLSYLEKEEDLLIYETTKRDLIYCPDE